MKNVARVCRRCNEIFIRRRGFKKYCSLECRKAFKPVARAWRKMMKEHGATLEIPPELIDKVRVVAPIKNKPHFKPAIQQLPRDAFFLSREWKELRYRALKTYGIKCMCCNATGCEMHVDHIKPRSLHPELALTFSNLQVLCRDCNLGKSNKDETDWRATPKKYEIDIF